MSETAPLGAVATTLKPTDFGAFKPPADAAPAFDAVIASMGFTALPTSGQLVVQPAASGGRTPAQSGKVVPLQIPRELPPVSASAEFGARSAHEGMAALRQAEALTLRITPAVEAPFDGVRRAGANPATMNVPRPLQSGQTALAERIVELTPTLSPGGPKGAAIFAPRTLASAVVESSAGSHFDPVLPANEPPIVQGTAVSEAPTSVVSATAVNPAGPVAGFAPNAEVSVGLHHPRFAEGLSQQIVLLAHGGVQQARITINPPDLGPVDLRIVVRNDEVVVQLASPHAVVRDAIEEALPRLREQFDSAGLRLADSEVFSELPRRSAQQHDMDERFGAEANASELAAAESAGPPVVRIKNGLVDAYV